MPHGKPTEKPNVSQLNWLFGISQGHKRSMGDCPDGPVVRNLPCNAEDSSLIPGQGTKIPRGAGQLGWQLATTESVLHKQSLCVILKRSHTIP